MLTGESLENIKDGKCFLAGRDSEEPHDLDENRHGTHVAGVLLDLAPWVHVYIGRIKENGDSPMHPSCVSEVGFPNLIV